jgi:hypothetical protein
VELVSAPNVSKHVLFLLKTRELWPPYCHIAAAHFLSCSMRAADNGRGCEASGCVTITATGFDLAPIWRFTKSGEDWFCIAPSNSSSGGFAPIGSAGFLGGVSVRSWRGAVGLVPGQIPAGAKDERELGSLHERIDDDETRAGFEPQSRPAASAEQTSASRAPCVRLHKPRTRVDQSCGSLWRGQMSVRP